MMGFAPKSPLQADMFLRAENCCVNSQSRLSMNKTIVLRESDFDKLARLERKGVF